MTRPSNRVARHFGAACGVALFLAGGAAFGEDPNFAPTLHAPPPAFRGEDYSSGTGDAPAVGLPARTLFRDTGSPLLNSVRTPQPDFAASAGAVQFRSELRLGGAGFQLPGLRRGFEPQDADLKIGPAYFKLNTLSGTVLASDNINLDNDHRRAGVIAIVELGATLTLQLTESLQLTGSGYFVYLPLQGKAGVLGGVSQGIAYGFALEAVPVFYSQLTYDTNLAGWPVLFSDEFTSGVGFFDTSSRDDFGLFEGGGFRGEDRAGRYAFSAPGVPRSGRRDRDPDVTDDSQEFQYYSNRVSALTERLLPGEVRLRIRAYHENLWYNQGGRGLPSIREDLSVVARSERPDFRFKPYLSYEAFRSSLETGFNQSVRLGASGPITDQLSIDASVGLFYSYRDQARLLWNVSLFHDAGPYTRETLQVGQDTSFFQDELYTYQTYRLNQILGPRLNGTLFATHARVEDLREDATANREEWLAGLQFNLTAGPRTTFTATGLYFHTTGERSYDGFTARLTATYLFTETLNGRFLYQYQSRDDGFAGRSYDENLVLLQLTKTFY